MRILIAHGDGIVLADALQALGAAKGFEVVGAAHDAPTLGRRVTELLPEVVLLDLHLPGAGGLESARRLRARHPDVGVVLCSVPADRESVEQALLAGARGTVLEPTAPTDFPAAIRAALGIEPERAADLTSREADVLEAVARGLSNKAIAGELRVTVQTVKFHLTSIYRKLHVSNRTEAARWALRNGLAQ